MTNSQKTLFLNAEIIGSSAGVKQGWLRTEGSLIHSYGQGQYSLENKPDDLSVIDCSGYRLLPGFIDLHTHGCLGTDFNNASFEEIQKMTLFYASHGVTSLLATTYTATAAQIDSALHTLQDSMGDQSGARILGVHLEGPWLNQQRCGAQKPDLIREADPDEVLPYLNTGLIRLIAVAPEVEQNQWLISECRKRGISVAAGHTNATYEEMQKAVALGVNQVTHTFNAMSPLNHRQPGIVGAALTMPELRCELIADNVHVHPAIIKLVVNAKSPRGVILISDSISPAGMPDGHYELENQKVICLHGEARLEDGTLAGSTLTLEKGLANLVKDTGLPLQELWSCSSLNAAEAVGVDQHKGKINPGYDADLVLLDSNLQVVVTMVEGKVIYRQLK